MRTLATATTAAFAGGALPSQTVLVPSWRTAPPETFLARLATEGPGTGLTLFPFEPASLILLVIATRTAAKQHRPVRLWASATACLAGTFALLLPGRRRPAQAGRRGGAGRVRSGNGSDRTGYRLDPAHRASAGPGCRTGTIRVSATGTGGPDPVSTVV
ncbi:hypothetical protein QRX60_32810 [Amycolatopsis mongoliensis]|uniref:Uncharacterized protein n=1 Tax=Amycolatopsis mongoliensis TaxID=715475 RepID=A0A9Y2JK74_9PSEU|nr:hypothetical protein [Amycolatopsis sp. 4-36]WIX98823.1 hypothetical protein QRX60_32810 [Amycolatopsis sp. 4-36]